MSEFTKLVSRQVNIKGKLTDVDFYQRGYVDGSDGYVVRMVVRSSKERVVDGHADAEKVNATIKEMLAMLV